MHRTHTKDMDLNKDIDVVCFHNQKDNIAMNKKRIMQNNIRDVRKERAIEQIMMKIPNTNINLKTDLPINNIWWSGFKGRNQLNLFPEKSKFNSHRSTIFQNVSY